VIRRVADDAFRGVRMKAAVSDDSTDNVFVLIEIAPGARFPDHDHDSSEFGVILTGDVTTGGRFVASRRYLLFVARPRTPRSD